MTGKSKFQISRSLDERIKRIIGGSNEYDSEFSQVSSAYILGFNYGNITNCVGLTTNYQLHHAVFPVVGLVFFRSSPNEHDIKTSLRSASEFSCSPNGLGSFKSDKNEHLFLIYSVSRDTNSVEKRIFNVTKGAFTRRKRLRLNVLNDPYCPRQVHKGCSDDLLNLDDIDSLESAEDENVDHLIFFIHGVGGVCDVRFRSCVEVVADFKKMANNLLGNQTIAPSRPQTPSSKPLAQHIKRGFFRKHSTGSSTDTKASDSTETTPQKSSSSNKRPLKVECLPVSWHSCTRKQIGINDQLSLISLGSVPKLRHFLNKVVMDALLYSSGPVYNQTIINNVGDEINRLYSLFMEKHPNFTGSVSLAGHSLGSVIMFDILAHQISHNASPPTPTSSQSVDGQKLNLNSSTSSNETERMDVNSDINSNNITSSGRHHENDNDSNNNQQRGNGTEATSTNQSQSGGAGVNQKVGSGGSSKIYSTLDELLRDMDLTSYIELFHKEHIDLNTLLLLTDFDMKELNLPLGVRRKLSNYINTKKVSLIADGLKKDNFNKQKQQQSESGQTETEESQRQPCGKANCGGSSSAFDNMNTGQYLIKYPQLKFEPRCFFSFGSPTPMFLNIRGIADIDKNYKFPTCDRIFNIFHPYDPLAYRFEPLIDPRFKEVEPVQVAHHRGGKRIHVQLREGFAKVGHDIKHRLLGSIRGTWSSFTRFNTAEDTTTTANAARTRSPSVGHVTTTTTSTTGRNFTKSASSSVDVEVECDTSSIESGFDQVENTEASNMMSKRQRRQLLKRQALVRSNSDLTSTEKVQRQSSNGLELGGPKTPDAILVDRLSDMNCSDSETTRRPNDNKQDSEEPEVSSSTPEFDPTRAGLLNANGRIDYVLQEKPVELLNEYIFAFTSHANYWQNEDSALMVLKEIYKVDNIHLE